MKYNIKKILLCSFIIIALVLGIFPFIAGDSINFTKKSTDMCTVKNATAPVLASTEIKQRMKLEYDTLESITILPITYDRKNNTSFIMELTNTENICVYAQTVNVVNMINAIPYTIVLEEPYEGNKGEELFLKFKSIDGTETNSIAFCYGDSIATARVNVPMVLNDMDKLYVNETAVDGMLCYSVSGTNYHLFGQFYWHFYGCVLLALAIFLGTQYQKSVKNKQTVIIKVLNICEKYSFLIEQMVKRDFKSKYKRSVLGVFWSFLNPLLTLAVQYAVFSTLFKSSVENFPIYLLIGIICFNYFSEAVNMSLTSIVGNTALILKVYIPKYIFPFTRTLSSTVNLLLSLIPLAIFLLLTHTKITLAVLLVPFALLCLFALSLGVGLILSTSMVFFRDTQFLWGVINMLWLYLTPIFYPESIIPTEFLAVYRMNPLYPIITFLRTVLIQGVSPEPGLYLACLLAGIIPMVIGLYTFKKNQDKFVFNL